MADNSPFESFDWWGRPQRHALPFRREVVVQDPTAEQWQPPAREPAQLTKTRRPGDPLMGTEAMEDAAGELGQAAARKDPREIAIQLATLLSGIYAGKNGKRPDSHRVPFKEGPPKGMDYHPNAPGFSPKDLGLLDPAGFYSDLQYKAGLSARKTGTLEQWRRDLVDKAGVKPAEWQQMGLDKRDPKEVWSQEQLLSHAAEHRLWLTEQRYGGPDRDTWREEAEKREVADNRREYEVARDPEDGRWYHYLYGEPASEGYGSKAKAEQELQYALQDSVRQIPDAELRDRQAKAGEFPSDVQGPLKFGRWTLDENNPSNREVVLSHHGKEYRQLQDIEAQLAAMDKVPFALDAHGVQKPWPKEMVDRADALREQAHNLRSNMTGEGHFTDAENYQGHVRYSMGTDAKGQKRMVFGEFQSEPDAQIRDAIMRNGAPYDEAKVAELGQRVKDAAVARDSLYKEAEARMRELGRQRVGPEGDKTVDAILANAGSVRNYRIREYIAMMEPGWKERLSAADDTHQLARAEHENAQRAPRANGLIGSGAMNQALVRKGLIEAARSNVPGVVLEPGNVQNDRYNLSHAVPSMEIEPRPDGVRQVWLNSPNGSHDRASMLEVGPDGIIGDSRGTALRDTVGKHINDVLGAGWGSHVMSLNMSKPRHFIDTAGLDIGGEGMRAHYGDPDTHQPGIYGNILQNELQRLTEQSKAARRLPGIDVTERKAIAAEPGAAPRETIELEVPPGTPNSTTYGQPGQSNRHALHDQPMHSYPIDERQRTEILKGMPYFKIAPGIAGAGLVGEMLSRQFKDDEPDLNPFGP